MKFKITLLCSYLLSITWIISILFHQGSSMISNIAVTSGLVIFPIIALFVHFMVIRNYVETSGKKKTLDIILILGIYSLAILFPYIPYVIKFSTDIPLKENPAGIGFIIIIVGLAIYSYYDLLKSGFRKETVFNKKIYKEYFRIFLISICIACAINFINIFNFYLLALRELHA